MKLHIHIELVHVFKQRMLGILYAQIYIETNPIKRVLARVCYGDQSILLVKIKNMQYTVHIDVTRTNLDHEIKHARVRFWVIRVAPTHPISANETNTTCSYSTFLTTSSSSLLHSCYST